MRLSSAQGLKTALRGHQLSRAQKGGPSPHCTVVLTVRSGVLIWEGEGNRGKSRGTVKTQMRSQGGLCRGYRHRGGMDGTVHKDRTPTTLAVSLWAVSSLCTSVSLSVKGITAPPGEINLNCPSTSPRRRPAGALTSLARVGAGVGAEAAGTLCGRVQGMEAKAEPLTRNSLRPIQLLGLKIVRPPPPPAFSRPPPRGGHRSCKWK